MDKRWLEKTVKVKDMKVFYRHLPNRGAPVILVQHGLWEDSRLWMPIFETVRDEYEVYIPDFRGGGFTGAPPGSITMDNIMDDFIAFADVMKLDKVNILGDSLAAHIVANFSIKHPTRVTSMIMGDPFFWNYGWKDRIKAIPANLKETYRKLKAGPVDELITFINARNTTAAPRYQELCRNSFPDFDIDYMDMVVRLPVDYDPDPEVGQVVVPTKVMIAGNGATTPDYVEKVRGNWTERKVPFEIQRYETGHVIRHEQPELYRREALAYFDRMNGR